jgi:hypothetical protein
LNFMRWPFQCHLLPKRTIVVSWPVGTTPERVGIPRHLPAPALFQPIRINSKLQLNRGLGMDASSAAPTPLGAAELFEARRKSAGLFLSNLATL